jgi:hypothetical protein
VGFIWNSTAASIAILWLIYVTAKGEVSEFLFDTARRAADENPTAASQTGAPVQGQDAGGKPGLVPAQCKLAKQCGFDGG